jgi:hypothetical protein
MPGYWSHLISQVKLKPITIHKKGKKGKAVPVTGREGP